MPRRSASAFSQLQRLARKLLAGLTAEIRSRRSELERLEREFEQLTGIAGLRGAAHAARQKATKTIAATRTRRRRINWTEVLGRLPPVFKASDIRNVRGLKDKRASELFAAITRWIDSGAVKKKARGVYARTK